MANVIAKIMPVLKGEMYIGHNYNKHHIAYTNIVGNKSAIEMIMTKCI